MLFAISSIRFNLARRWLLATLLLLLAGCSVKFVYNQLDWLIPWYLDDYVTLNAEQYKQFKQTLNHYLDWHREEQLPVYADFLKQLATNSEDGLNKIEITQMLQQAEMFADTLFSRLGPSLGEILATLTDEQVEEMAHKFVEKNNEYRKKYIDKPEKQRREKRAEDITDFVERWTGSLTDEQEMLIQSWSQNYQLMSEEFLQSRAGWQARFVDILKRRTQSDEFFKNINKLFDNRRIARSEAFNQKIDYNRQMLISLYLDIDQSLSDMQRNRLKNTINEYAEDLQELSVQSRN